jgi:predicted porin
MKKSLLALAALTAFVGAASAQSSVTLFGVVDLAARQVKNPGGTIQSLTSDGYNSNRLGVRGIEDMGGGMRAGFWLEGGMSPDVGSQGGGNGLPTPANGAVIWNRRATVSLMGGFGEVRLGRDYTPSFWNHTVFDAFGTNGVGSGLNVQSGAAIGALTNTFVRANNSIGYFLPAMGGLYGQVMLAAGEGVTSIANKYTGLRLGYAAGPVNVAFAMGKTKKDGTGALADSSDTNFGGSFNAGFATFMGHYSKTKYNTEGQKLIGFGINAPLGSGTLRASVNKASSTTASTVLVDQYSAKQIALGYVYDMTKRTALYTTYSKLSNGGSLTSGGQFNVGGPGVTPVPRGGSSTGLEFGLRHAF